jgi:4-hydroxy-3-polyprenylbenzoate decarboxylase/2,5-furandicarboxylate decarboxylase 1
MSFVDLRAFLDRLRACGELVSIARPVDPDLEIAAYIRKSSDMGGPAFLFERVRGSDMRVVGGVFCSPRKALLALETDDHHAAIERFVHGIEHAQPPIVVPDGPCKEVKLLGDAVDLTALPFPRYSEQDGGRYSTVGVVICKDPETGIRNAGIYRMQLHSAREMGIEPAPYTDFAAIYHKAESADRPLEVAVALGVDPVVQMATQARLPLGVDELTVAGGIRGEPVPLVRCETIDLEVPATAEIVLEGRVLPHLRRAEGPFGEFTGYVGAAGQQPVFVCSAITMRHDAIFQAGLTGIPVTENHVMKLLSQEANLLVAIRRWFPEVTGVSYTPEGGADFMVVFSLKQRYAGQARNLIMAALGSPAHPKLVVVTDDDVDIYDSAKVWWAILTRAQPSEDVIILARAAASQLDPSAPEPFVSSVMGIDATRPFGKPFPEIVRIPGVDAVPDWTRELAEALARCVGARPGT